jgi:hypothetical protein
MFIELEKYPNYPYPLSSTDDEDAETTATSPKKRKVAKSKESIDQEAKPSDFGEAPYTSVGYEDYPPFHMETGNFGINQPDINQPLNDPQPLDNPHPTIGGKKPANQELG